MGLGIQASMEGRGGGGGKKNTLELPFVGKFVGFARKKTSKIPYSSTIQNFFKRFLSAEYIEMSISPNSSHKSM